VGVCFNQATYMMRCTISYKARCSWVGSIFATLRRNWAEGIYTAASSLRDGCCHKQRPHRLSVQCTKIASEFPPGLSRVTVINVSDAPSSDLRHQIITASTLRAVSMEVKANRTSAPAATGDPGGKLTSARTKSRCCSPHARLGCRER
jgi:hypothetical protein